MQLAKNTSSIMLSIYLFLTATWVYAEPDTKPQTVVQQLNSEWNKHFNDADHEALANLYAENAMVSPGNGTTLNERSAIQGLFKVFFENGFHNHSIETITSFKEGDSITQLARWQVQGQKSDESTPVYGGILISVYKQDENGDWKAHLHVWNMSS